MRKKTNEEFLIQMEIINSNIEILEPYIKDSIKIRCRCKICGHEWMSKPSNLIQKKGCKMCHFNKIGKLNTKSHDAFISELMKIQPHIKVIDTYKGATVKLDCLCLKHDKQFVGTPDKLLQGRCGCPDCIAEKWHLSGLKTHDDFVSDLKLVNPYVEVLGEYTGSKQHIEVKCLKCGHIWSPQASSLTNGFGCPNCTKSKGESAIEEYLKNNKFDYVSQKRFEDLRGIGNLPLSYDFYLEEYNLLIEYQGRQHEEPVEVFGGEEYFKKQVEHDKRKRDYAAKNAYNFLEIWHYEYDNINDILERELRKLKNPVTTTV